MLKTITVAGLLAVALSSSPRPVAQTFGLNQRCLHGQDELAVNRARREQAVRVARQINRAESAGSFGGPSQPRRYVPLDDSRLAPFSIQSPPEGFKLRFYTDTESYAFSVKDTLDRCGFAVFSDQDGRIYEAVPKAPNARVLPAEIP
jgi:hypothetical protein